MTRVIKNGEEVNFGFSPLSMYDKVAHDYPICFTFTPAIYLPKMERIVPFEELYEIYGDKNMMEDAKVCIKFTVFPSQEMMDELARKFLNFDKFGYILTQYVDKVLESASSSTYTPNVANLDITDLEEDVQVDIVKDTIEYAVDSMIESMNNNFDRIIRLTQEFYFLIGYNVHRALLARDTGGITKRYIDDQYLQLVSSRYMTTYYYVNGIK